MGSLFVILSEMDKVLVSLILVAISLGISFVYNIVISFRLRASKSFYLSAMLFPVIVTAVVSMVSIFLDATATAAVRIATVAVALGLIRFRSVNGRAEELLILFGGIAFGLITGLGYIAYAAIFAFVIAALYVGLSYSKLFQGKRFAGDKLLKITIPETLQYSEVFDEIFAKYLKNNELVRVKTTGLGTMFILSYKIEMKNSVDEKQFIDDLRTKNGNLEISILPYVEDDKAL